MKDQTPIDEKEGIILTSSMSLGLKKLRKYGRIKAIKTVTTVCIPKVSQNTSVISPKKKPQSNKELREMEESNFKIKYTYNSGTP